MESHIGKSPRPKQPSGVTKIFTRGDEIRRNLRDIERLTGKKYTEEEIKAILLREKTK